MLKSTIVDTRVRLSPSKKLLDFLKAQGEHFSQVPSNVAKLMKANGCELPASVKVLKDHEQQIMQRPKIDAALLQKLTAKVPESATKSIVNDKATEENDEPAKGDFLYLTDLHWLNNTLTELRKQDICQVFLYELIESSELILPENELKPRNPELEARCQRLREEQHNREYHKMTKNVDAGLKNFPEDTISYQNLITEQESDK